MFLPSLRKCSTEDIVEVHPAMSSTYNIQNKLNKKFVDNIWTKAYNATMIPMQYVGILVESVKASNGTGFKQDS